jgi:heat shock protein HslJ
VSQPLRRTLPVATALSALLAGCALAPEPPALAGSRWQLVALASMDDAQGTQRPAEPARYTLAFGTDGRATLQLDCNRGSAGWQATPAAADSPGRRSGSLQFSALATTRAMCPPGSLAPALIRALPFVRSYLLQGGQLHLSLMADGGILTWAPAP